MALRTRLLLGYGYLVVLLLLSAGTAAHGFYALSKGIEVVLADNYESVDASMAMVEALERQDSMVLTLLIDRAADREPLTTSERSFERALARVEANVTSENERPIIAEAKRAYGTYDRAREAILAPAGGSGLSDYHARVLPAFLAVKELVWRLAEVNQQAMLAADERSRHKAIRNGIWLGALVVVALASLVLLARWLQRGFLDRLAELQRAADAIAGGDEQRRVLDTGQDELGRLAMRLNEALDARDAARREVQGRVNLMRDLVAALLPLTTDGVALFGTDGRRLSTGRTRMS